MIKKLFVLMIFFQLIGCILTKGQKLKVHDMSGIFERRNSSEKLELKPDGTYILWNAEILFTPVIEQCDYASKGMWSAVAENVIEIISEDYYMVQKGYEYGIKKENKLSQDSLYIQVIFPTDFHPVKLNFTFNDNNSKSITTEKTYIVLPKSKYLWNGGATTNQVDFFLNADVSGTELYRSRILFNIFEEFIDTEKSNFWTITLPHFDRCFFEFKPYNKELIYVKGKNRILWRGDIWNKK